VFVFLSFSLFFITRTHSSSFFPAAAAYGHLECLRLLVSRGADLRKTDRDDFSVVRHAAINREHDVLLFLSEEIPPPLAVELFSALECVDELMDPSGPVNLSQYLHVAKARLASPKVKSARLR
jgi:Ankyrin repeats (many copies)